MTGGNDATPQLYDPAAGTFGATGTMASRHASGSATLLADGRVLVAGGFTATGPVTTDVAEIYDPVTGLFGAAAAMTSPRQEHRATLLSDGRVLVTGGADGATELSSAETSRRDPEALLVPKGGPRVSGARLAWYRRRLRRAVHEGDPLAHALDAGVRSR